MQRSRATNAHDLLTAHEAAQFARRSVHTVWRWMRDGRLPSLDPGGLGRRLIRREDLLRFLTGAEG